MSAFYSTEEVLTQTKIKSEEVTFDYDVMSSIKSIYDIEAKPSTRVEEEKQVSDEESLPAVDTNPYNLQYH